MKTLIFLWIALSGTSLAAGGSLADLRRQVAEQERQIRQLEIENARLRYMLTEAEYHQGDPLYGTTASGAPSDLARTEPRVIREVSPTPEKTDKPAKPAKPPERRVAKRGAAEKPLSHAVRAGENLYRISLRYGVDLDALFAANPGIDPHKLRVGQPVIIPRSEPMLAHRD